MSIQSAPPADQGKTLAGIYTILLPAHGATWQEVRRMVADKNVRMDETSSNACQDPAIVVTIIKAANSMAVSGGRPPATTIKSAIERLGVDETIKTLESMKEYPQLTDERVTYWYEQARVRGKRVAKVARIVADSLARSFNEDCEAAAGLQYIGEMLAVAHFKNDYTKMADEQGVRTKILYRLEKDFKYSALQMGVNYLRRIGIPEVVLFAIDENSQSKVPSRVIIRPICAAASEIVIAAEAQKLDKLQPGGPGIGPKSVLRTLKMTDAQYESIYRASCEYLMAEIPQK